MPGKELPANRLPDKELPLPEQAYEHIKAGILNMSYRPGAPLSEVKLAAELGISRTPVREALRRLTTEGLVQWVPGKGRVVYTLSLHDIDEIFDIKEALESLVAYQAAQKGSAQQMAQLAAIMDEMTAVAESGDVARWTAIDHQFHATLFAMAGNRRAERVIANLNEQWHRLRVGFIAIQGRIGISASEHRRIAELIRQRDAAGAAQAMREHLSNLRQALLRLVQDFVVPYVGENL